jgi:GTP-binding protein
VHAQLFDLFVSLDASDEQLDYTTLYASAREGWAVKNRTAPKVDMSELFDTIIEKGND